MFLIIGYLSLKLNDGITPDIMCNILELMCKLRKADNLTSENFKNILLICIDSKYIEESSVDELGEGFILPRIYDEISSLLILPCNLEFWVENNKDIFAYPSEWIGKKNHRIPQFVASVDGTKYMPFKPVSTRNVKPQTWFNKLVSFS